MLLNTGQKLALAGWSLVALAAPTWAADASPRLDSESNAASFVEAAIAAGLAGDASERERLLAKAMEVDPDYAPARWQSGQVRFDGQWKTPDQVASRVSEDPRRQEYRELRDQAENLADHVNLAQWCMREGLSHEERYHWTIVLLSDPSNRHARKQLGLQKYRGALLTEEQVAAYEQGLKVAEANRSRYMPRFRDLCRDATTKIKSRRATALKEIAAVSDIAALAALEEAVRDVTKADIDEATRDLHLAWVSALSNMPQHEATLRLMNLAIFSPAPAVRRLAAQSLQPRKSTDYVPTLLGALSTPIEATFDVVALPDGTVRMLETTSQASAEAGAKHVQNTNFEVEGAFNRDGTLAGPNAVRDAHLNRAAQRAAVTADRVARANAALSQRNARIQEALEIAAGMEYGEDADLWWKAWASENELQYETSNPTYTSYEEDTYTYTYPRPRYLVGGGMTSARETTPVEAPPSTGPPTRLPGLECFAAGTTVWTISGPAPIERIAVGDMVLSQHPGTGELDYRPVLETTVGEAPHVAKLTLPGETLIATGGHRFWVEGRGWEMMKSLKPSMQLHALDRGLEFVSLEDVDPIACHNLVVEDFHTFFVGSSKLLVHDKSCPLPTLATTPGSTAQGAVGETAVAESPAKVVVAELK